MPFGTATDLLYCVTVELKPFNDCALNRALQAVCTKVAQTQLHLPNGRRLLFRVQGTSPLDLDAEGQAWRETLSSKML